MKIKRFYRHGQTTARNAGKITGVGLKTVVKDPQIMVYTYLAVLAIYITTPPVSKLVYDAWHRVETPQIINGVAQAAPHELLSHLGLVAFSLYWAIFVTSFFTCAVSASVLAKLSGKSTRPLYGLRVVGKKFLRVAHFSLFAAFFFPLAIIAKRKRLPKDIIGVLGSSFSLSMSQVAPAVLVSSGGIFATIRHADETIGKAWHESLLIRVGMIGATIGLGLMSFLPKLVQNYWFDSHTARLVGWVLALILGLASYAVVRVLGTVFTTALYYEASRRHIDNDSDTLVAKAISAV